MANPLFEKLKKTIIEGATFSAAKAEEAARKGKQHLDILTEKRKLSNKLEALGGLTLLAIEDDTLDTFRDTSETIELLGEIKILKDKIEELTTQQDPAESNS